MTLRKGMDTEKFKRRLEEELTARKIWTIKDGSEVSITLDIEDRITDIGRSCSFGDILGFV